MNKKYQIFLVAIAVTAITAAVFIPSLAGSFLNWDDGRLLEFSGWRGFSLPRVEWWFSSFAGGDYKPLVWASYACDYAFWGLYPVGYHLSNVILHSLNAFLLFLLLRALLAVQSPGESARGRPLPVAAGFSLRNDSQADKTCKHTIDKTQAKACGYPNLGIPVIAAAALFFSLHPLRVETVAWITERKGCLSAFFFLLSVLLYVSYARLRPRAAPAPWRYLGSLLSGVCAGLAKPSAISLPLALFILDFYPLDRRREGFRRLIGEKLPFLLVSFVVGVMAIQGQRAASALAPLKDASLVQRLLLASRAPYFYLGKTLCPIRLSPVYFQEVVQSRIDLLAAPISLVIISFIFLLLWRRKIKWPLVSWCLYLALLFPVSGFFRTGAVSVADRFSYLPALAVSFAVARLLSLPSGFARPIAKTAAVLVLAALAFLAVRQQGVWRTPRLLWESAARRSPESALAFNNLGNALSGEGEDAAARKAYETALRLKADNPEAHTNLGNLLARAGDSEGAAVHYRVARRL
ncbi:MAG: tetratricopeptide repeat protein [Candidatus Aureabacteria bacterium]|nr:tetratricopeptide repeat protein [Candidatus Auribacterota bacterium]